MIIFAHQKGITIVAMPNIKSSLIYERQKYKKNRPCSEKRQGKRYCDCIHLIFMSLHR
jgi:hypothetical protein